MLFSMPQLELELELDTTMREKKFFQIKCYQSSKTNVTVGENKENWTETAKE